MAPKLILFNGPRHSGKDTAALHVAERLNAYHFKFSAPIKASIKTAFNLSSQDVDYLESIKTQPTPILFGKSYVEAQISFSEEWAKPSFGQDVFGRWAVNAIRDVEAKSYIRKYDLFVSSDSGFACEAWPIIENLFGVEDTLLVRVYRQGKTFNGDSRSYIELPGVETVEIENNDSISNYHKRVIALAQRFCGLK
jgi:hypothetical protein